MVINHPQRAGKKKYHGQGKEVYHASEHLPSEHHINGKAQKGQTFFARYDRWIGFSSLIRNLPLQQSRNQGAMLSVPLSETCINAKTIAAKISTATLAVLGSRTCTRSEILGLGYHWRGGVPQVTVKSTKLPLKCYSSTGPKFGECCSVGLIWLTLRILR